MIGLETNAPSHESERVGQVAALHRLRTDVVGAGRNRQGRRRSRADVVGVHDMGPGIRCADAGRPAGPSPTQQPGRGAIGPGDLAEPQGDAHATGAGELVDLALGHDNRLGGPRQLDGAVLIDPFVAVVGVHEAETLLHETADPGLACCGRNVGGAVIADAVVGAPRTREEHRQSDRDSGGEVDDGVAAVHRPGDALGVEEIRHHRLRTAGGDHRGGLG